MSKGFFAIGIENPANHENIGTLWRSAYQLGADYIFTLNCEYKYQSTDTYKTWRQIPLFGHTEIILPMECCLIAIETDGEPLDTFVHPKRCVYILGNEDKGLSEYALHRAHKKISIPSIRQASYNVAMAGTIVMYDRYIKGLK